MDERDLEKKKLEEMLAAYDDDERDSLIKRNRNKRYAHCPKLPLYLPFILAQCTQETDMNNYSGLQVPDS